MKRTGWNASWSLGSQIMSDKIELRDALNDALASLVIMERSVDLFKNQIWQARQDILQVLVDTHPEYGVE